MSLQCPDWMGLATRFGGLGSVSHPTPRAEERFRISLRPSVSAGWLLRAEDRWTGELVFNWQGPMVERLLSRHRVLRGACDERKLHCSKHFLQQLALSKTAIDLSGITARDSAQASLASTARQTAPRTPLSLSSSAWLATLDPSEFRVAELLKSRPGQHFSFEDVQCLLTLNHYRVPEGRIEACLDGLTRKGVLQRIDVPQGRTFYDCDVSPHLHVYDPETGELCDAVVTGVISTNLDHERLHISPTQPSVVTVHD